jgi:hypothetical protein
MSASENTQTASTRIDPPQASEPPYGKYYAVIVSAAKNGVPADIRFYLVPGTSAPDDYVDLQIEIERTLTVLKVLFLGKGKDEKSKRKFDEYFARLGDLAHASIGQDQVRLGKLALTSFQNEIVTREAGIVKNAYIRRLGAWALFFGALATRLFI